MHVIYIDVLFFINFIMDYIVITALSEILKLEKKHRRFICGAVVGAVYSVCIFFVDIGFVLSIILKILISMLIIYISYFPKNLRQFLKYLLSFYTLNLLFGGGLFAGLYFTGIGSQLGSIVKNGVIYFNISVVYLILGSLIIYILLSIALKYIQNMHNRRFYNIEIGVDEKNITIRALVDTGNSLFEKSTGLPVIIAEEKEISKITDITTKKIFLIPFTALGTQNGVIMGFKPDYIRVIDERKYILDAIIGVYSGKLSKNEDYSALINPSAI